jgi:hypothetical protein
MVSICPGAYIHTTSHPYVTGQQQRGGWPAAATVNAMTYEGASWMEQTQARGADMSHHGGQEVSLEGVEANGGPHKPGAQGLGVRGAGLNW